MTAEIISVGTELLLGNIVNTNAAYLAEQCAMLGLSVYYQSVVGDNAGRLADTIRQAMDRSDIVFLGGGLGPTEDDLTKETVAEVLGRKLVEDVHSRERIAEFFRRIGKEPTENNWKQAQVIEDCIVLDNANGSAPGIIVEDEKATLILLPGPPIEMIPMFETHVFPYLREKEPDVIVSKMLKICGVGESSVENDVKDLIHQYTNPTIATYAKTGEVHIRVTAKAETEAEAKKLLKPVVRELKCRFCNKIYSTDDNVELEDVVVALLKEQNLSITTVESCTGGLLAGRLVNVPGVSDVFKQGYVTYSNKAKRKLVGVKKDTLSVNGAVSEKTAKEMAKGAMMMTGSDIAVSVTGIAGPDGGSEEKPVGLVYIACNFKGKVTVKKCQFSGGRRKVRESSVAAALVLLRDCLLENIKL